MAEVGELTWIAEIKEIADAKRDAEDMNEGLGGLADQARESESAMDEVGESSGSAGLEFLNLNRTTGFLIGILSLLGGELFLLVARFTGVTAGARTLIRVMKELIGWIAAGGLSGAIGTATGLLKGFIGWLAAGSAGALGFAAAIGVVLGLIGVWILKTTGILDAIRELGAMLADSLPGWARDALLAVISIFAGGLAILGAMIVGFMDGGLSEAFARGEEVLDIFAGAWGRLFERVRKLWDDFKSDLVSGAEGLAGDISGALGGTIRAAWNAVVPSEVRIGSVEVAGKTITEGFTIDLPQLQSGGMIEETGAFVGHEGEMVLPADVSRAVIDAIRGIGGGGGSAAASVNIEQQTIDIGDQQIDVSQLDRTTLEILASLIAEKQGDELAGLV